MNKFEPPPIAGRNSIGGRVTPAEAPKAVKGRAARRAWASEVNRVARHTGDFEEARQAGADLAMAVIDCDAALSAHGARTGGGRPPPFTLSQAAKRREANDNGAGDRIKGAILRDEKPDWASTDNSPSSKTTQRDHPERNPEQGKSK
jgi:hypothetical protein